MAHLLESLWNLDVGQQGLFDRWRAQGTAYGMDDRLFFTISLALAHSIPVYFLNLCYTLFTRLMPETSEKWRFLPGKRAPPALVRKAIAYVSVFHFIVAPGAAYALFPYAESYCTTQRLFLDPVPGLGSFIAQLLVCYFFTDLIFYWCHRALHVGPLYRAIHKQHHEFNVSIGFAAQYAHPVEVILGNSLPVMFAYVAFKFHISVWMTWTFIALTSTTAAHSGIWYPGSTSGWHDWHHSANIGNLGSAPFWDIFCGTDRDWAKRSADLRNWFAGKNSAVGEAFEKRRSKKEK